MNNPRGDHKNEPFILSSINTAMYMLDLRQERYISIFRLDGVHDGRLEDENIVTFKIIMVKCIMNIIKLIHPKNEYLYIPEGHDCDDNIDIWIQTRKEFQSNSIGLMD